MKKTLILIVLFIGFTVGTYGQSKLKSRDVRGEWQLVIDIDEDMKDNLDEDEEYKSDMGDIIASEAIDFAQGIIDGLDILFDFQQDGRLKITVNVMGETEAEYAEWEINQDGELVIIDDDDDDEVWILEDEILMGYNKDGGKLEYRNIYLMRVDRD